MLVQLSSQGYQQVLRVMNFKVTNGWTDKSFT